MATITGNNANNTLNGTSAADTISGRGGNDALSGLPGDDRLFGELGDDVLTGGLGDDLMDGGAGADVATYVNNTAPITAGNAGFDGGTSTPGSWRVSSATTGVDALVSVETVVGTNLADTFRGGDNTNDTIRGGGGDDRIVGGYASRGSDTIYGGGGNDSIAGGEETNFGSSIPAGTGDTIYGGTGNDDLAGVDGDDRVLGEAGSDRLSGGRGRDLLTGGSGGDTFTYDNMDTGDYGITDDFGPDLITDFVRGQDRIFFRARGDEFSDPEIEGFADLDSNRNGVLDAGDAYVEVRTVAFGGASRASTVIDVGEFNSAASGPHTLTVFGVTGLRAGDFAAEALA